MNWKKTGKVNCVDGGHVITYVPDPAPRYVDIHVESRTRPIPHSGREGSWMFTSFFVVRDGVEIDEKHTLAEAKELAEELIRKDEKKWHL